MERKTLLIGLLALTGLGFGADAAYRAYVEKPFLDQEATRAKKEKERSGYRTRLVNVKTLVRDLPNLQAQSLPSDPVVARQRYQAWWWQKVKSHQWGNPSVDIGQPSPVLLDKKRKADGVPVHSLSGTIRGVATLQQVTDLLDDFYATPILQKLDSIQLNPVAGGKLLSVSLTISALALENATEQSQLPSASDSNLILVENENSSNPIDALINPNQLTSVPVASEVDANPVAANANQNDSTPSPAEVVSATESKRSESTEPQPLLVDSIHTNEPVAGSEPSNSAVSSSGVASERPWQSIVKRNVFQAGGGMQIANKVMLSAITSDSKGNQEAWFRMTDTKQTQILKLGDTFQQGVLSLKVIKAQDNYVTVLLEGSQVRVKIGDTIANGMVIDSETVPDSK